MRAMGLELVETSIDSYYATDKKRYVKLTGYLLTVEFSFFDKLIILSVIYVNEFF